MTLSKPDGGTWRIAIRGAALRLLGGGAVAALLFSGCGGVYHLHPDTGRSYQKIMRMHRSAPFPQPQMNGEDAEIVMENLEKASRTSDMKQSGGSRLLLPLQR